MASGRRKAKPRARGRVRQPRRGNRLNRTELSKKLGHDRHTVSKYLAQPGAPRPDRSQRYDVDEVKAWIESVAPKIANAAELAKVRESILRMEAEDKRLDLDVKKGRLVDKKKIEPTIAAAMKGLTADMQLKFEQELPAKYEGLDRVARAQLNADAIDWIMTRFKFGTAPITS